MFGWRRKKNVKPLESVDAIAPVRVSPLDLGSPSPEQPSEPSAASAPDEPVAEDPGASATSPTSEPVAPTAWEAAVPDPAPVVEAPAPEPPPAAADPTVEEGTEVPDPAEPPVVRSFVDEASTPVLRFSPVAWSSDEHKTAAPAEAPTSPYEAIRRPREPAALDTHGPRMVALPYPNRALAERMRSSQHEMAQLSMHMDAWMDHAVELRTQLIPEWDVDGLRPSYTDFVVRAVARSLTRNPQLNSVVREREIELLPSIDVGVTTPIDGASPVLVVAGADRCSLKEIVAESTRRAAEYDATSPPTGPEATFVVASLGAYGVDAFTPIVLAPNVATLGIGRVRDETRWEGDRPVRSSVMTLTLSWDHRAFGGAVAAEFLVEVREMLEQPYRLLVD